MDGEKSLNAPQASKHSLLPDFLKKSLSGKRASNGLTLCLVKLLDGQTLQLYADSATLGQNFINDGCVVVD